jgi:hypothetical protein
VGQQQWQAREAVSEPDHKCNDCGDLPGPGSVARIIGKDSSGHKMELCSRCWIRRDREAAPMPMQLKAKGKKK